MNKVRSICLLWTVHFPMEWHVPLRELYKSTDPLHVEGWLQTPRNAKLQTSLRPGPL